MDVLFTPMEAVTALKEAVMKIQHFQEFQDTLLIILLLTGPMDMLTTPLEAVTVLTALLEEVELLQKGPRATSSGPTAATARVTACTSSASARRWPLSRSPSTAGATTAQDQLEARAISYRHMRLARRR